MQIKVTHSSYLDWTGDTLALGFLEDAVALTGDLAQLDQQLGGGLKELIAEEEFTGKANTSITSRIIGQGSLRKIILVGMGPAPDFTVNSLRLAAATVAGITIKQKSKSLAISFPLESNNPSSAAGAITEGVILGLHQDNRFKSEPPKEESKLETVDLLGLAGTEVAVSRAEKICSGVIFARELVAAPANELTPVTMAEIAVEMAAEYNLELEVLEQEDCEKLGMGSFLGVAKASELPPKFIHLTYKPPGTPRRKLAIVGKGLTFDSGGLNIKTGPGCSIEKMKVDMGGAGATLGAAKAIAQLKPNVEVHFISAATENMISGKALHPGDILTASNGKTIEVNNTDAEGRLTLADALVFAEKLKVEAIIDLATLTGACVVALGDDIGGMWSTDENLAAQLKAAAEQAGEKFWPMPLEEKYWELMKSKIADMKNTGTRAGGSITAALFLKQFIKETAWAHLDIAGPVWAEKKSGVNNPGATGFPVRTLVNWVLS